MTAALLRFAALALACAAACALAGSARLLGPFIASIGVLCTAAGPAARRQAALAAGVAYAVCLPLGLAAHALLPVGALTAGLAALVGFALLRGLNRPHAPALAMVAVLALNGASLGELGGALAMTAALLAGGRLEGRTPVKA